MKEKEEKDLVRKHIVDLSKEIRNARKEGYPPQERFIVP